MKRTSPKRGAKSISVRDRAYQYIQQAVADGVLEAGSSVSELGLAKELGSSRTPIREAMNQLAAEGLLEAGTSGGMIVASIDRSDIIELYELREALEVYSVGRVAMIPLRAADKDRLQFMIDDVAALRAELQQRGSDELDSEQMRRLTACDLGFHALLMSMAGNSRIQKIINETRLLIRIFAIRRAPGDTALLDSVQQYHQRILDAVSRQDGASAMTALSEHIQLSQQERLNEYDRWHREMSLQQNHPGIFDVKRVTMSTKR